MRGCKGEERGKNALSVPRATPAFPMETFMCSQKRGLRLGQICM